MEKQNLIVSNPRIIEFYRKYNALDFEKINIAVIEMLENIVNTKSLDNVLASQIIQNFEEIKQTLNKKENFNNDNLNKIIK